MQAYGAHGEDSRREGVIWVAEVKLVVIVSGGLIQEILSNASAEALILDCDTEGFDRLRKIRDWNFEQGAPSEETIEVFDTLPFDALVDTLAVEHFFNEMGREANDYVAEVVSEVQEGSG